MRAVAPAILSVVVRPFGVDNYPPSIAPVAPGRLDRWGAGAGGAGAVYELVGVRGWSERGSSAEQGSAPHGGLG